jgi:uncharacterized protein YndB with AHSA1/START domain
MGDPERTIFKVFIRGSIEAVWRELTKTHEPQGAFFNCQLHTTGLKPGAPMRMRSKNGKYTAVVGEVLEFDPPHRYSHTLRFTQFDDPPCKVTHELKEVEGGVEYVLIVENVPKGTRTEKELRRGGSMITNSLKAIVETGRPSFGIRLLYQLFPLFELFTPKRCRSENWPL